MEREKKKQIRMVSSFNNIKWNTKKFNGKYPNEMPKKFRWHDEKGRQLTAGGLLIYDDKGIWAIGEKKTKESEVEWTDPGGKYKFEDCDIYTTISREFSEELYFSSNISRDCILDIKRDYLPTYVNGHQNKPVYICYIVHVDYLKKYEINLNPQLFLENREKALKSNPDVPPEYFSSIELRHISFEDLENINLSYRLKRILKYGSLSSKIPKSYLLNKNISLEKEIEESIKNIECAANNFNDMLNF